MIGDRLQCSHDPLSNGLPPKGPPTVLSLWVLILSPDRFRGPAQDASTTSEGSFTRYEVRSEPTSDFPELRMGVNYFEGIFTTINESPERNIHDTSL